MKNLLEPSAKSVLMPLGLTAAAAAADAAIHTKIFGSGTTNNIKGRNGKHYENS